MNAGTGSSRPYPYVPSGTVGEGTLPSPRHGRSPVDAGARAKRSRSVTDRPDLAARGDVIRSAVVDEVRAVALKRLRLTTQVVRQPFPGDCGAL